MSGNNGGEDNEIHRMVAGNVVDSRQHYYRRAVARIPPGRDRPRRGFPHSPRCCAGLGWEGTRRKRKLFYGTTAAEVQEKLLAARADFSKGLPVALERQNVAQFLDHWLESTVRPRVRPRSYESFELIVRCHLKPELGRIRLEKLTP